MCSRYTLRLVSIIRSFKSEMGLNCTSQSTFKQDWQNPNADNRVIVEENLPRQKPTMDDRLDLSHAVGSTTFCTLEEQKPTADGRLPRLHVVGSPDNCILENFKLKRSSGAPGIHHSRKAFSSRSWNRLFVQITKRRPP